VSAAVYTHPAQGDPVVPPDGITVTRWRARDGGALPPALAAPAHAAWRAFDSLGLFASREYGAIVITHAGTPAHRTMVLPRYYAFPFLGRDDLQLGDTLTLPAHRGRGLATLALRAAPALLAQPGRALWYVVDADNTPSRRAVESAGWTLAGRATRHRWGGIPLTGAWRFAPEAA
jgi:GNAT superfamily N-acetyltransferase